MFIIILLNTLKRFDYTINTDNLIKFLKALMFELKKIQTLEKEEENRKIEELFRFLKEKKEHQKDICFKDLDHEL